jgi:hypothetical protein
MIARGRLLLVKLLRYTVSVAIVAAITLALTGLFCQRMGWTTPLMYGRALFWAGLLVSFLGAWRFFGSAGALRGPGDGIWDQAYASYHPLQFAAGLWHDVNQSLNFVIFAAVSGATVMTVGLVLVSRFTSCLWCTLF